MGKYWAGEKNQGGVENLGQTEGMSPATEVRGSSKMGIGVFFARGQTRGKEGYIVRSVGQDGGYKRGKGQLAKVAEGESAGTVTVPEWNGDMFLWL